MYFYTTVSYLYLWYTGAAEIKVITELKCWCGRCGDSLAFKTKTVAQAEPLSNKGFHFLHYYAG